MNMDTHMSGSTVKKHISLKMVFEYSAIRTISYQSWFLVYQRVLPSAFSLQHPRLLHVRSQVKVWIDKHGETRSLLKHQKSYMNENDGEKKYRAGHTKYEFWRQKWKLCKKRRDQESRDKTA